MDYTVASRDWKFAKEWVDAIHDARAEFRERILPNIQKYEADTFRRIEPELKDGNMARFLLKYRYNGHAPTTMMEFLLTAPETVFESLSNFSRELSKIRKSHVSPETHFRFELCNLYSQMRLEDQSHRFIVSSGLATKLWNTSPAGIENRFFRLPFPTIQIEIQGSEFITEGRYQLTWRLWQEKDEDIPSWVGYPERLEKVYCIHMLTDTENGMSHAYSFREIILNEAKIDGADFADDERLIEMAPYTANDLVNFACNVLLYMNLKTSEKTEDKANIHKVHTSLQGMRGKKRKTLEEKLAAYKNNPIFILGKSVILPSDIPKGALYLDSPQRRAHWRRGHWRHQACGEHWQEHKWIHVEPTLITGYGTPLQKDYVVSSPSIPDSEASPTQ